jgi:hypothetical protein
MIPQSCRRCLCATIVAACAVAARAAPRAEDSPFRGDERLEQRITVRAAGMPIDQLLPRLSTELGVSIVPASTDVGDVRVALFAEELAAYRILTALTSMLNLDPDGGYSWSRKRRGEGFVYELQRSQQARVLARERVRRQEEALQERLRAALREMPQDPEQKKRWADPSPLPRMQRATQLVASLSREQLDRLLEEGVVMVRQPEATREQQQVLARLVADQIGTMDAFLRDHPEEVPRYQNIDPAAVTMMVELHTQAPNASIVVRLDLGPYKGGSSYGVWHLAPAADQRPPTSDQRRLNGTAAAGPSIPLDPRSWSMADVLADLARRSRRALVSDCYTTSWGELRTASGSTLEAILEAIDRHHHVRSEHRDGFVLLRSRFAAARQAVEVPERRIRGWLGGIERDGVVSLETLEEICRLSDAQLHHLREHPEIALVFPNLGNLAWGAKHEMRLYGLLSPAQRAQVSQGGARLTQAEMTPEQQRQFRFCRMIVAPHVVEADPGPGAVLMRLGAAHHLQMVFTLGGREQTREWWLAANRQWDGKLREPPLPVPAERMVGKMAPRLAVRSLDGVSRTLPAGEGRPFLALFRDPWPVPYVGTKSDGADVDALVSLLSRRPNLRQRVVVICPREKPPSVREWADAQGKGVPTYSDESGATTQAFGRGPLPRAVLIGPDGRIRSIQSGYPQVIGGDWDELIRRTERS